LFIVHLLRAESGFSATLSVVRGGVNSFVAVSRRPYTFFRGPAVGLRARPSAAAASQNELT
jgi:hypothetical protein